MAGTIVPILEKRVFEFGYLPVTTQDIVIHPAFDVTSYSRVKLLVRVHSITATTGNFSFRLFSTFPSEQDPAEFTDPAAIGAPVSISTASPNIIVASNLTDPQAFLKVVLRATQVTAGNTLYGEFSAAFLLRES